MPRSSPRLHLVTLAALLAALGPAAAPARAASDALWRLVHDACVPHARAHEPPAPCAEVDLSRGEDGGHVVLKDRRGMLQYLLMPTRRSSGIDDPALLRDDAPPYWQRAWEARRFMSALRGAPVPRESVALTVNSAWARSQDQLHLHVSCVRTDLRARLRAAQSTFGPAWQPLAGGWMGHPYQVRRVDGADLGTVDPFRELAAGVPGAREAMGRWGLAVVPMRFVDRGVPLEGFVLMAGPVDLAAGAIGAVEHDVQDHDCTVLAGDAPPQ